MATLDLNEEPDEGDGEVLLDLNEAPLPEDDHSDDAHGEDQNGSVNLGDGQDTVQAATEKHGDEVLHPFDLNLHAIEEQEEILADEGDDLQAIYDNMLPEEEEEANPNSQGLHDSWEHGLPGMDVEELDDTNDEEQEHENGIEVGQTKNLTNIQRQEIYEALLARSNNGRLKRNSTTIVAEQFNVTKNVVQRLWKRVKECREHGQAVDIKSRKTKNCGRKKIQVNLSHIISVPLHKRSTIRSLAQALGVKRSTLHRCFKEGLLRRHSNSLKPFLKEANKKERLKFCISMLDQSTLLNDPKFREMYNIIHADEKWFYLTRKNRKFYLLPEESDPHRCVQNKNAIVKVMFLSAVARPRFDEEGNCTFDGKIGVWAFVRKEPAQRKSENRPRGTLVTKSINVDRSTMRSYMIAKLLPAIVAKWPQEDAGQTIWIQQDNARSHVPPHDDQFAAAIAQTGFDIRIMQQPPNSPDMNVLDLGFFASLQSLIDETNPSNIDELIDSVHKEYRDYNPHILNRVFLTLQGCCIEVMKDRGGNKYKVPHMSKQKLEALGILPKRLSCDRQLYENSMEILTN